MLSDLADYVIGVDPDRDRITLAIVDARSHAVLATTTLPTTPRGYRESIQWADRHIDTRTRVWSIEGAGSYGAGLLSALTDAAQMVIEFDHPLTPAAKDGAKSDSLDAVRATREVLGRQSWSTPRARGAREGLRALIAARDSAKVSRTSAINVLRALILTAPADLREELRQLTFTRLLERCRHLRPDSTADPEISATKRAIRSTAHRVTDLSSEMDELEAAMHALVLRLSPALLQDQASARCWPRRS